VNPFTSDDPRHRVWDRVVREDIAAFVAGEWQRIADDFVEPGFFGLDACGSADPRAWRLTYATLAAYRDRWLAQSQLFRQRPPAGEAVNGLLGLVSVPLLELTGDSGVLLKRFDGSLALADGGSLPFAWESLFVLRRVGETFRVQGFVGYLPLSPR
jgi:hypothetical protein